MKHDATLVWSNGRYFSAVFARPPVVFLREVNFEDKSSRKRQSITSQNPTRTPFLVERIPHSASPQNSILKLRTRNWKHHEYSVMIFYYVKD